MPSPLVSVCIPSYRAEAFLAATLQSVLDQDLQDWEVVLVDDASPDGSWAVAESFAAQDARIRLVRNDVNLGAAATWNRAVALAEGRYVKVLCSDDVLRPGCLGRQVQALEDHPGAVMVAAKRDIIDAAGRTVIAGRGLGRLRGEVPGPEAVRELLRTGENVFGEPSTVLFRGDDVRAVGFHEEWHYTLDLATYVDVLQRGSLVCLDEVLGTFRISATSWSAALLRQQTHQARAFYRHVAEATGLDPRSATACLGRLRATGLGYLRMLAFSYAAGTSWRQRSRALWRGFGFARP